MSRFWKRTVKVAYTVGLLAVLLITAGLAYLIYPARPSVSRFLQFNRFVRLPSHGVLNALDYLTIGEDRLFVAGESSGSVFWIRLDRRKGESTKAVSEWRGEPTVHGIAVDVRRQIAFVTRSDINVVDAFRPSDFHRVARIPVAEGPDSILYDRIHDLVYVTNAEAEKATVIDAAKRIRVDTIPLAGRPEDAVLDPSSGLVYQNIFSADTLAAVDPSKHKVVGRWPTAPCKSPTGIAIDGRSHRAFISCLQNSVLVVFDLTRKVVVSSVPVARWPDSIAFDSSLHRIYVAGLLGRLTIVQQTDPDSYKVLDSVSTHVWAHTLAVDPRSHHLYVAYAGLFVPARIAVFSERS